MLHDYCDIIEEMTKLLRASHAETRAIGDGPAPECPDSIDPTTDRCRCVATPIWHDEHGVPRFAEHHPDLCPDIGADEVALLAIACQGCRREFLVQMSWSRYDQIHEMATRGLYGPVAKLIQETGDAMLIGALAHLRAEKPPSLSDLVRSGAVHYGDPPNVDCCAAGPTMNCLDLRVVEFWTRGPIVSGQLEDAIKAMEWRRVPELEVELPDTTDPELAR